jgi:hypothetical protein
MPSHGWQESQGQAREIEQQNYDERAAGEEARERVTPSDGIREHLWLNDRLPPGSIASRFTVSRAFNGPYIGYLCQDAVTGKWQRFESWAFMECWMSELSEERS